MDFGQHKIVLGGADPAPVPVPDLDKAANSVDHPHPRLLPEPKRRKPVGQVLHEMGAVSAADIAKAAAMRKREDARIGDILLAHGMVDEETLYTAIATQYGACVADFKTYPADVRLIEKLGAERCLRDGILPWRRAGGAVLVASCRPEEFEKHRAELTKHFGVMRMAVASETAVHDALLRARQRKLAASAETRVAASESCREMDIKRLTRLISVVGTVALAAAVFAPRMTFIVLTLWAIVTLVINSGLKIAAAFAQAGRRREIGQTFATAHADMAMPIVSVMVPLFREREIAARLIKRLSRIDYPRELLDICLVVEEDDQVTQFAIHNTNLPRWMRMIVVPRGGVKTKPRALNFALDFCRGSIIGIWDAEDAPEKDQIKKVVRHFDSAAPDVACLQGVLDFYNSRTNWLARCFTVEYASWFRVILPGYERMGLMVPLGGTTLFFRRKAIEELGGWDAHNVTEDADLGIRLARHGYRTELISTVTDEEANCRAWPWIKQRSRWLKGYAMTWAVHMRSPRKLLNDLGPWRFFGVQALFLGTLSQFVLAPFLWSFWALLFGLPHPLKGILPQEAFIALGALFLASEVITVTVGMFATATSKHKWLWPWVPTLHAYYPLATAAAIKGLWEIVVRPYYWDKTAHGVADTSKAKATALRAKGPRRKPVKPVEKPAAKIGKDGVVELGRGVFVGDRTPQPRPPQRTPIPVNAALEQSPETASAAAWDDHDAEMEGGTGILTLAPAMRVTPPSEAATQSDDPIQALRELLDHPQPLLPPAPDDETQDTPKPPSARKRIRFNYYAPECKTPRGIGRVLEKMAQTLTDLPFSKAKKEPPLFISSRGAGAQAQTTSSVTDPAPQCEALTYGQNTPPLAPLKLTGFSEAPVATPLTPHHAPPLNPDRLYLPFVPRSTRARLSPLLDLARPKRILD